MMGDGKCKMLDGRCLMENGRCIMEKKMGKITGYIIHVTTPILH